MNEFLEQMIGRTVPGGCDDCDATQELTRDPRMPGVYVMAVRHDHSCPTYRRMKRERHAR